MPFFFFVLNSKSALQNFYNIFVTIIIQAQTALCFPFTRGESRTVATPKMEGFVIIVKCSVLDVVAVLDPSLLT